MRLILYNILSIKNLTNTLAQKKTLRSNCLLTGSFLVAFSSLLHVETVYFNFSDFKGGYVVLPDDMPKDDTKLWVVVDTHGAGGLRNEGMGHRLKKALEPEKVIFIVPSFASGYQSGSGEWADQMMENFKFVQKRYSVHDKMFVHGHSAGGQFAHRFAFTTPKIWWEFPHTHQDLGLVVVLTAPYQPKQKASPLPYPAGKRIPNFPWQVRHTIASIGISSSTQKCKRRTS